jgi:hypothetical protein
MDPSVEEYMARVCSSSDQNKGIFFSISGFEDDVLSLISGDCREELLVCAIEGENIIAHQNNWFYFF